MAGIRFPPGETPDYVHENNRDAAEEDVVPIIVGAVACGPASEPIKPGSNIYLADLLPELQALVRAAMEYGSAQVASTKHGFDLKMAAERFAEAATIECPSCGGSGETPVQDRWSYGDGRGRGEGHYTTGGGPCPCCKGKCVVPATETSHAPDDDCGQPDEPPEPEPDYAKDYPEDDD